MPQRIEPPGGLRLPSSLAHATTGRVIRCAACDTCLQSCTAVAEARRWTAGHVHSSASAPEQSLSTQELKSTLRTPSRPHPPPDTGALVRYTTAWRLTGTLLPTEHLGAPPSLSSVSASATLAPAPAPAPPLWCLGDFHVRRPAPQPSFLNSLPSGLRAHSPLSTHITPPPTHTTPPCIHGAILLSRRRIRVRESVALQPAGSLASLIGRQARRVLGMCERLAAAYLADRPRRAARHIRLPCSKWQQRRYRPSAHNPSPSVSNDSRHPKHARCDRVDRTAASTRQSPSLACTHGKRPSLSPSTPSSPISSA
jgi:hypothetical protein